jgi:hypothetical protein
VRASGSGGDGRHAGSGGHGQTCGMEGRRRERCARESRIYGGGVYDFFSFLFFFLETTSLLVESPTILASNLHY